MSSTLITQVRLGIAYYNNVAQQSDYGKNTSTDLGSWTYQGVALAKQSSGDLGQPAEPDR